jgi:hypothetical protein
MQDSSRHSFSTHSASADVKAQQAVDLLESPSANFTDETLVSTLRDAISYDAAYAIRGIEAVKRRVEDNPSLDTFILNNLTAFSVTGEAVDAAWGRFEIALTQIRGRRAETILASLEAPGAAHSIDSMETLQQSAAAVYVNSADELNIRLLKAVTQISRQRPELPLVWSTYIAFCGLLTAMGVGSEKSSDQLSAAAVELNAALRSRIITPDQSISGVSSMAHRRV